jgi:hypothetical protein
MQFREPVPLPGLLDKDEGFFQRRLSAGHFTRRQQGLGKVSHQQGVQLICARRVLCGEQGAQRRDIFLRRLARCADASIIEDAH